jgi:hypothetical protein
MLHGGFCCCCCCCFSNLFKTHCVCCKHSMRLV